MIAKVFELDNLPVEKCVEGITDFEPIGLDLISEISGSRGEFVGYICNSRDGLKLFRDRVGARNLYYAFSEGKAYVSTDIVWVVRQRWEQPMLNSDYIKGQYIPFQVPFNFETVYREVFKVMPGEIVTIPCSWISNHWTFKSKKYWTLKFGENKFRPDDLRDLIVDAVAWRKSIIDAPYCSYLSGGIDSSSITMLSKPSMCFSGFYDDEEYSELNYVIPIVTALRNTTKGFKVKITEGFFHTLLEQLPVIMPDPMCGLGVIPQVIVAKAASRHRFKYSFTGEGGDEVFYGYPWNTLLIQSARKIQDLQRDKFMVGWESIIDKAISNLFYPMMEALVRRESYGSLDGLWKWDYSQCVENNIMRFNVEVGLPAILTVDECVGKFTGIMPVSPLVDHRIIEYVASIAPEERAKIPKYLLRRAMGGIVPGKILDRYEKMGFPVPISSWKWPMLTNIISSFQKRGYELPKDRVYSSVMGRSEWAVTNLELICRMMERRKE